MYVEEPKRNVNWGSFFLKGIFIVIFVAIILLLIWLFTRNNSKPINVDYDNNQKVNETIKLDADVYSESFITNYTYYHDTAKDYFLINEIPENGKTIRYTIQDLINKNILLKVGYEKSTCDLDSSYISINNDNGNYTMTTFLVCGRENVKTTEKLACSKLCENCTKDTLEYQFKQAYSANETTYDCPKGYTKTGSGANTKCSITTTVNPTKEVTYNKCADGSKPDSNNKCKVTTYPSTAYTKDAIAKTTYSCADGSTPNSNHKCPVTIPATISYVDAIKKTTYSCADGSKVSNYKCPVTVPGTTSYTRDAIVNTTYSCADGKTPNSNHKCPVTTPASTSYTKDAIAKTTYSCADGATPNSSHMCPVKKIEYTKQAVATTTYSCSQGTLVNTKYCRIYSTNSYYQSYETYKGATYNGCTYSGSYTGACTQYSGCTRTYYKYYCSSSTYHDAAATAKTSYSCTDGSKPNSSNMCPVTTTAYTQQATVKTTYSCADGATPNSNHKCPVTTPASTSYTKDAIVKTTYSCYDGATPNSNHKCPVTTPSVTSYSKDAIAKTTYYCENGATPTSNHKCPVIIALGGIAYTKDAIAKTTYSCADGATPNSNHKCPVTTNAKTSYIDATKTTSYKCPSTEYTKIGIGESSKCTKTKYADPIKTTKAVTKYKYKWSTETSLSGWTKTGETRTVKASS